MTGTEEADNTATARTHRKAWAAITLCAIPLLFVSPCAAQSVVVDIPYTDLMLGEINLLAEAMPVNQATPDIILSPGTIIMSMAAILLVASFFLRVAKYKIVKIANEKRNTTVLYFIYMSVSWCLRFLYNFFISLLAVYALSFFMKMDKETLAMILFLVACTPKSLSWLESDEIALKKAVGRA
jgi:hypothetical protein